MERRTIEKGAARVEVRQDGDSPPVITGYAAVFYDGTPETEFELWRGVKERIMPGAFDEALRRGDDARGLFNHDPALIIGRRSAETLSLRTDVRGLIYEIKPPEAGAGPGVVESIRRRDVQGSSFAFRVESETWREEGEDEIREINQVELFDVGPVTFPAYEATSTGLRAAGGAEDARASHARWKAARQAVDGETMAMELDLAEIIE